MPVKSVLEMLHNITNKYEDKYWKGLRLLSTTKNTKTHNLEFLSRLYKSTCYKTSVKMCYYL